ncbi:MAG: PDZ domain-containing protein [Gammaproteobacteria bacterium]|nr:MAG: PDZ domain-containing protein [Gammaproteobacteria bacterium]
MRQIQQHGRVIRAWMGAAYQDIPPKQDDPMPVVTNGVIITAVAPNGPAARAGLTPGDVITRVDDKWVPNQFALRNRESQLEPGTKINVSGVRGGQAFRSEVTLEEKPQAQRPAANR